jgi:hypothetical protein
MASALFSNRSRNIVSICPEAWQIALELWFHLPMLLSAISSSHEFIIEPSDIMETQIRNANATLSPLTPWRNLRAPSQKWSTTSRSSHSMLRPTVAYLRAMREADIAVVNFARKYSERATRRSFSTTLN